MVHRSASSTEKLPITRAQADAIDTLLGDGNTCPSPIQEPTKHGRQTHPIAGSLQSVMPLHAPESPPLSRERTRRRWATRNRQQRASCAQGGSPTDWLGQSKSATLRSCFNRATKVKLDISERGERPPSRHSHQRHHSQGVRASAAH